MTLGCDLFMTSHTWALIIVICQLALRSLWLTSFTWINKWMKKHKTLGKELNFNILAVYTHSLNCFLLNCNLWSLVWKSSERNPRIYPSPIQTYRVRNRTWAEVNTVTLCWYFYLFVCCLVLLSTAEIIVRSAVNSISLKKKFGLQSETHQEK